MKSGSHEDTRGTNFRTCRIGPQPKRLHAAALFGAMMLLTAMQVNAGQTGAVGNAVELPDAPQTALPAHTKTESAEPCNLKSDATTSVQAGAAGEMGSDSTNSALSPSLKPGSCPPFEPHINWYARFLNGPHVKRLTPREKAWLAFRNVVDPFNALTILGSSAIAVGSNSHSAYGPGMSGFGRYVGVSYSQDVTAEFFGTFLIPSIAHQDPHYHRLPGATVKRRIAHAIYQVIWTQGDDGRGMANYANLVGFTCDDAIGNLYVPGQQTRLSASATRYFTGLATAPIENFVTEFLPDVASHIHVRVVLIQRIINQIARTESTP